MTAKVFAIICLQVALFNTINAQCLNRLLPGQNILPMTVPVAETILPNQLIYSQPIMEVPYPVETIVTNQPTIIQDSTVANNLANALQLLVVSNLLSNTLPLSGPEILLPSYGSPLDYGFVGPINAVAPFSPIVGPMNSCGCGSYNYIY